MTPSIGMFRWLVPPALSLAVAGPAYAICEERTPPTRAERFEQRVRDDQRFRRSAGMPASRRHVVRVIRSQRKRSDFGLALLPRELSYLDRRDRITGWDAWRRLERYAARRPSTFGGLSLGNDYPRGGAAVLRFTRGTARHREALRGLAPFAVRVRRVDYSERRLLRRQKRIDVRALEDEGITIQVISADIDRSRVVVEYISERPDAARRIREHFGPLVVGERLARRPTRLVCVKVESATVGDDDRSIKLDYFTNSAYAFERVFVVEEEDRVRIAVVERAPNGVVTLVGSQRTAEVELSAPLGDRELVHARSGKPLSG